MESKLCYICHKPAQYRVNITPKKNNRYSPRSCGTQYRCDNHITDCTRKYKVIGGITTDFE